MQILSGKQAKPRRILLYGQHGVGKSSWAAGAPNPLFLNIEDGLNDIDCKKTAKLADYGSVVAAVSWLVSNKTDYQTVCIDTLDWLEHLVFKQVAQDAGKNQIEDIGYGKGYKLAGEKWKFLLSGLDALRDTGKSIVLLAHAKIDTFESPETERYDRYEPDLHEVGSSLIQEWCDEVLFASFRVFTRTEDLGFGKTRAMAIGGKERFIRTNESAAAVAKNRLRLPDELPLSWAEFAKHMPDQDIAGIVKSGSSKSAA